LCYLRGDTATFLTPIGIALWIDKVFVTTTVRVIWIECHKAEKNARAKTIKTRTRVTVSMIIRMEAGD
jgi:hypothetical protein